MLCMLLVSNVTVFIAGCIYASLAASHLLLFVLCLACAVLMSLWVGFLWSRHNVHWFNVVCWNLDGFGGLLISMGHYVWGWGGLMDVRRRLRRRSSF